MACWSMQVCNNAVQTNANAVKITHLVAEEKRRLGQRAHEHHNLGLKRAHVQCCQAVKSARGSLPQHMGFNLCS